jgi:hypothetical protein
MDSRGSLRETDWVLRPGASRQRLARTLNTAYAHGLLSQKTLIHRLDLLFGSRLIDPAGLVGDLTRRVPRRPWPTAILEPLRALARAVKGTAIPDFAGPSTLLALDWTGAQDELLVGRHKACDIVLSDLSVSRRHARLMFRDGSWVLQDLDSTNGTYVNEVLVGRCELRPGDQVLLGGECLIID